MIDADAIAHRVLKLDAVRRRLRRSFGTSVFHGVRVDRRKLARRAFRNPSDAAQLNRIVHPEIRRQVQTSLRIVRKRGGIALLDAALLLETGADRWCDELIFVDSPASLRARRVRRRGWDSRELRRRERLQWPLREKKKRAGFVIRNTAGLPDLKAQVHAIWQGIRKSA